MPGEVLKMDGLCARSGEAFSVAADSVVLSSQYTESRNQKDDLG